MQSSGFADKALSLSALIFLQLSPWIWALGDIFQASEESFVLRPAIHAVLPFLGLQLLMTILVGVLVKNLLRGAVMIFGTAVIALSFGLVEQPLRSTFTSLGASRGVASAYFLFSVVLIALIWRLSVNVGFRFSTVGVALILSITGGVVLAREAAQSQPESVSAAGAPFQREGPVVHIIFDGLGDADGLREIHGIDITSEVQTLSAAGMTVLSGVRATQVSSIASVSEMLAEGEEGRDRGYGAPSLSRVVRRFREADWTYAHYGETYFWLKCSGMEDVCLSGSTLRLSELQVALLRRTAFYSPLRQLVLARGEGVTPAQTLEALLPEVVQSRRYSFVMLTPPHPPFIFQKNCSVSRDAIGTLEEWTAHPVAIQRYGFATKCVLANVSGLVEKIIAVAPDAIIIISGDHGPMFRRHGREEEPWSPRDLEERLPVFLAVRVPEGCTQEIHQLRRLVDIYPRAFDCLRIPRTLPLPEDDQ